MNKNALCIVSFLGFAIAMCDAMIFVRKGSGYDAKNWRIGTDRTQEEKVVYEQQNTATPFPIKNIVWAKSQLPK